MNTMTNWMRRRAVVLALVVVGLPLLAPSASAIQRLGTFTVCEPPSTTFVSTTCARITGTTQTGRVGGANGVSSGNLFSVQATNFKAKLYQVTFRDAGSSADCHRASANTHVLADVATGATTFRGPSFYKTFVVPTQTTTGRGRICVQDMPDVVSGQAIDVVVL